MTLNGSFIHGNDILTHTHISKYPISDRTCTLKTKLTEPAVMAVYLAREVTMADRAVRLAGCWPGSRLPHTSISV